MVIACQLPIHNVLQLIYPHSFYLLSLDYLTIYFITGLLCPELVQAKQTPPKENSWNNLGLFTHTLDVLLAANQQRQSKQGMQCISTIKVKR